MPTTDKSVQVQSNFDGAHPAALWNRAALAGFGVDPFIANDAGEFRRERGTVISAFAR